MTVINEVFFLLLDMLDGAFDKVMPLFFALFVLTFGSAIVRMVYAWLFGQMGNVIGDVAALLVLFWVFLSFGLAAKELTDGAGRLALQVGSSIVGAGAMTPDDFTPEPLWAIGSDQADKILATKAALCTGTWECMRTLSDQFLLEVAALGIYAAFAFLIFQMVVTVIGYKVNSLFVLIFTPAAMLPFTKSFSEGAIQGVVNGLVKLTIIAMVAGIAAQAFDLMELPDTPVFDDIIPAFLLASFIAFLAWQTDALASTVISAAPQLSGHAITKGVGNIMRTAAIGGGAATSAAILGNREKATIGAAASELASGAARAPGRISNAASAVKSGEAFTADYWNKVRAANSNAGGGGAGGGSSTGNPRTGGAWDGPPSHKQRGAAEKYGIDIGGMTKGEASVALENAGMDPSWYGGSPSNNGGGSTARTGGGAPQQTSQPAQKPRTTQPPRSSNPQPPSTASNGLTNSGKYMVPENHLHSIGSGGGYRGTGWKNQNRASVRKHATAAISGARSANAQSMAASYARHVHFGAPLRQPK